MQTLKNALFAVTGLLACTSLSGCSEPATTTTTTTTESTTLHQPARTVESTTVHP